MLAEEKAEINHAAKREGSETTQESAPHTKATKATQAKNEVGRHEGS